MPTKQVRMFLVREDPDGDPVVGGEMLVDREFVIQEQDRERVAPHRLDHVATPRIHSQGSSHPHRQDEFTSFSGSVEDQPPRSSPPKGLTRHELLDRVPSRMPGTGPSAHSSYDRTVASVMATSSST